MDDSLPPLPPKFRLKPRQDFVRANPEQRKHAASRDHDVFAWRQQEQTLVHQSGIDEIKIVRRSNRRAIDYWVTLTIGNLLMATIGVWGQNNLFVLASCGAGILVFTVGLTWIMWGVMRRY